MVEHNVRVAVLSYLDRLPVDSAVHPTELADRLGLSADQVNPYLEAARQGGDHAEIVVTEDGSVRLHPRLKGQFSTSGPAPGKVVAAITKAGSGGAFDVLKAAIEKVPAVRYALGVAGIAAAIAIIKALVTDWRVAVFGVVVMLVLMVVLLVFAKLTSIAGEEIRPAALTFMWFSLAITIATGSLLFTSVFFNCPISLKQWISGQKAPEQAQGKHQGDLQSQELSTLQERINTIDKQRIALQEILDEQARSRAQFAVGTANVAGRLSVAEDPDAKRAANELNGLVVAVLADVPRDKLSTEQAAAVRLAEATICNARGDYDATLTLITEDFANNAVLLAARSLQIRGDAFYGKQDWANAIEHYERVRAFQPANYFVRFLTGNCELHLSHYGKAIAAYTDVIDGPTETVSARTRIASFNNRGNTRVMMNEYKEAVDDFTKAINAFEADPKLSGLKLELAMVLANRGYTLNLIKESERATRDFTAVRAIIGELDSKHDPGADPDDLLSWLKRRAEPLGPTAGGQGHGSKKSCLMCHPMGS